MDNLCGVCACGRDLFRSRFTGERLCSACNLARRWCACPDVRPGAQAEQPQAEPEQSDQRQLELFAASGTGRP